MRIIAVATLCAIGLLAALWLAPGVRPFDLGIIIRAPIVLRQMRHIVPARLLAWLGGSPASAPSPGQRAVAPERLASRGPERAVEARAPAKQSLALHTASAAPDEPAQPADEPEPKETPAGADHRDRPSNSGQGSKAGKDAGKDREGKEGRDTRPPDRETPYRGPAAEELNQGRR